MHVVIGGIAWWWVLAVVLTVVVGTAAVIRSVAKRPLLAPLGAALSLLACCTLFFAPGGSILGVLPTASTLDQFRLLIDEATRSIYRQAIPADADASIVFLMCAGIGVLAVFADLIALTFRRPAAAGFPILIVLAIPAAIGRNLIDPAVFVVTALAYLFLLSGPVLRRQARIATIIAAGGIAAALAVPALLPAVTVTDSTPGRAVVTGVNPVLTLGNDLRQSAEQNVITYATASGQPHYLRLVSLENFSGDRWAPTTRKVNRANSVGNFADAPGLAVDVPRSPESTAISVGGLSSRWLPAPYPPTRITGVSREWFWDSDSYSIASPTISAKDQRYTVESLNVQPSPEQLLAAGTTVPPGLDEYLALPANLPGIISSTAQSVAASSTSNYAKAIALQQFFRNGSFDYSERAPVVGKYDGTGMALIARFLEAKSGYCVHFASSMAVMARSLGIPARVAVGFLPGRASVQNGQSVFEVSTRDLHAWPELYFEGVGWVQFEPTPGRGTVSDYANIFLAGVPTPPAPDTSVRIPPAPSAAATPGAVPRPSPSATVTRAASADRTSALPAFGLGALVVILVVLLVPATIRAAGRRRLAVRLRKSRASAVDAWREVVATASDLRVPIPESGTPRMVAEALGRRTRPGDGSADALARLLRGVESQAFAGGETGDGVAIARDVALVRTSLVSGVPPWPRVWQTLFPRSLFSRLPTARQPAPIGAAERSRLG